MIMKNWVMIFQWKWRRMMKDDEWWKMMNDDDAQEWRWVMMRRKHSLWWIYDENENILIPTHGDKTEVILNDQDDGSLLSESPITSTRKTLRNKRSRERRNRSSLPYTVQLHNIKRRRLILGRGEDERLLYASFNFRHALLGLINFLLFGNETVERFLNSIVPLRSYLSVLIKSC